jgi:hypothetical protein
MKTTLVLGALAAALLTAAPVWADHNSLTAPADTERDAKPDAAKADAAKPQGMTTESSLDIDLKLGVKGFRFGSRLFGREGYTGGAWLNGETRTDGFSLDGRLEREGKAHNFKMNIDLDEWLKRAVRWWSGGLTDL